MANLSFEQQLELQRNLLTSNNQISAARNQSALDVGNLIGGQRQQYNTTLIANENSRNLTNLTISGQRSADTAATNAMKWSTGLLNATTFGLGTLASGAINAGLTALQEKEQQNLFDYTTGKASAAFQQAGLPSWLAYMPKASSAFPTTTQFFSGSNSMTSSIPGNVTSQPFINSPTQNAMGVGDVN